MARKACEKQSYFRIFAHPLFNGVQMQESGRPQTTMSAQTYRMDFGKGLTCTATFAPPERGKTYVQDMEWSRRPTRNEYKRIAPQYRTWINGVRADLSTRWGLTMLAVLNAEPNLTEVWKFAPNQPPELLKTVPCNLTG